MFIKHDELVKMRDQIHELEKAVASLKVWCGKLRDRIPPNEKVRREKK